MFSILIQKELQRKAASVLAAREMTVKVGTIDLNLDEPQRNPPKECETRKEYTTKSAKEKIVLKNGCTNYGPNNIQSVDLNYIAMCMIESHMKKVSEDNAIEEIPANDGSTIYQGRRCILPGDNITMD